MNFQYQIFVNSLPMDSSPTLKGALATITKRWHTVADVKVEKNGVVVWRA